MQNLKYDTNEHIHNMETDSRTQRTGWGSPRGEERGDGEEAAVGRERKGGMEGRLGLAGRGKGGWRGEAAVSRRKPLYT